MGRSEEEGSEGKGREEWRERGEGEGRRKEGM